MSKKDTVFQKDIEKQFEFDESVASVFDDMLERSIPFYKENLEIVASLALLDLKENDLILDLGCSTGNTLLKIFHKSNIDLRYVGFDNAKAMLDLANIKAKAYKAKMSFEQKDILEADFPLSNVVISNYTLQFIRPINRERLVKKIYNSLQKNGVFFLSEKIIYEDKKLHKEIIEIYKNFKKTQGYSEFEISQKREALENVLVPYTEDENKKMLKDAGFSVVETIFKWANFTTFMAKK